MKLIECVPNISEGRNKEIINKIANTVKSNPDLHLLDIDPGFDTNRTVITFVGSPDNIINGAFELIKKAAELIDMNTHKGAHARMGATDVCPLIPIKNVTIKECVKYSNILAKKVADELKIPVYLYEYSATSKSRKNLAHIRKGEYEGMFDKIKQKEWAPDFGSAENNKKSGVTAIGVRDFLIAYNINLNTANKKIATDIALDIREAGRAKRDKDNKIIRDKNGNMLKKPGTLKNCKAVGWYIDEYKQAQVSINLTNYKKTSIHKTFEEVRKQARKRGVRVTGSEIVGLVPKSALIDAGKYYLKKQKNTTGINEKDILNIAIQSLGLSDIENFILNEKIIEYRVFKNENSLSNFKINDFIDITASGTPTPGGGSISAIAGSLGMALASMVSELSYNKKGLEGYQKEYIHIGEMCQKYKDRMLLLVDMDTSAYDSVIDAYRLPKKTKNDKKNRDKAIEKAIIKAADVPMEILQLSIKCLKNIMKLADICNKNSITDVGVALFMLYAATKGAAMNVIINANELNENIKLKYIEEVNYHINEAEDLFLKINEIVKKDLK
ncbi:MAG: glutamate formimidoyltransferase [Candidatus Marinimicrobia bacterium]|nr:glutamate formimidoyltransferase [Candidatus Neomarinimicrobiota bacterium]|tara:strand:+ start:8968 stop:10635 length:1668 start_codon:yes stop_codon:yes gene_type:complete